MIPATSHENRASAAGWRGGGAWIDQHRDINAIAQRGNVDVVFLGDSITQSWGGPGRNVAVTGNAAWEKHFSDLHVANFGISGDRTQHVLWRIEHGNFDGINPKVIVLLIGTNNLGDDSGEEIADGIELIVRRLEEKAPGAKILLYGIFPRGGQADDPMRDKIKTINQAIAKLDNGRTTFYVDLAAALTADNGKLKADCFRGDHLHLTPAGYEVWAADAEPRIRNWLTDKKQGAAEK